MTLVLVLTLATLGICGVNRSINSMFGIKKQGVAENGVFRILPWALTWCLLIGWMGTSGDRLQFMLGISFPV